RAGQHAFHRLGGQALRELAPADRHRFRTINVAVDERRLDAARAVTLHPAIGGEGIAPQLFANVFDHVVTLRLAVHQHVEADLFLLLHHVAYFVAHAVQIFEMTEFAALVLRTRLTDFSRLREGTDVRRRKGRQLETRLLPGDA